ncbi:MAG: endonuclease/exonuclease/phosphatase family protein [Micromonosporaceae bacterium]|nr:endonuclease/exonuclease/phosphatase family protein [Micromonosporaceae bacterium]
MLSLLTLNIAAAALPRAQALRNWLTSQNTDILVLTETSDGPGTRHLLDRYRQAGWHTTHAASLNGDRGTAILTRLPAAIRPEITAGITPAGRAVAVTVDTTPETTILGIYVPSSDREQSKIGRKREFVRTLLAALDRLDATDREHLILVGDYNVVSRDHQPPYQGFLPFEYDLLDDLTARGLTDAHQHLHPTAPVHSWFGRGGNAYRFDYIHTGDAITPTIQGCDYLQDPRTSQLTDHAAILVAADLDVEKRLPVDDEILTDTGTLF